MLYCICPGRFPEPDRRCLRRLVGVALDPRNGFAAVVPAKVRGLIARAGQPEFLRCWWESNARTPFFRHAETARAVRHSFVSPDASQSASRRRWRR